MFLFLAMLTAIKNAKAIDYFGLYLQLPFTVAVYAFYLIPEMQMNNGSPNF